MIHRIRQFLFLFVLLLPAPLMAQQSTPSTGLGFGGALATNGEDVFAGSASIGWPRGDEQQGSVYQYRRNGDGEWVEAARLQASNGDIGDFFGRSIYVDESTLLIGAPGISAVYVFEKKADGAWMETGVVQPENLGSKMDFGGTYARGGYRTNTLAMTGDRIMVAAYPRVDLDLRSGRYQLSESMGAVYVFKKEDGQWVQETVLAQEEPVADGFAYGIAAVGNQLFVGAPSTGERAGAMYVYTLESDSGTWTREMLQTRQSLASGALFGMDVAVSGEDVYVSAPGFGTGGGVFAFRKGEQGTWQEARLITIPEVSLSGRGAPMNGTRIAASPTALLVNTTGGTVYAYRKGASASSWGSIHALQPPSERVERGFGIGLAVHEDVAVVGSPGADYEEGLASVFVNATPAGPWEPAALLVSDVNSLASVRGGKVDCEEGAAGLFDCNKVDLISFVSLQELSPNRGAKMTDIWGWEDPETGNEYVIQGREDGVAFVDISDPYNPVYIGQMMKTEGAPGSSWRDVKVYKNHAFVVADGAQQHGLQIFDLTQLRDVAASDMPLDFKETVLYRGIASSHNIVINEETGYAYAVGNDSGGESCGGQLHMINIQDPRNPTFEGCFIHEGGRGTHDAQCVIYRGPDADYQGKEVCLNSNGSAFIIADVTDKSSPATISQTTYPNLAYTHQGWLSEDHRYFYMNDELDELNGNVDHTRTLIWDVAELDDPVLANEFLLSSRASDHNLYVKGNFMYQSNYQAGLRILDITDPANPTEAAHFDTVPFGEDVPGFGGSWSNYPYFKSGVIAVSSRGEGLFLVKMQEVDL